MKIFLPLLVTALVMGGVQPTQSQTTFLPDGHSGVWLGLLVGSREAPSAGGQEAALVFRGRLSAGYGQNADFEKWATIRWTAINPDSTAGGGLEFNLSRLWDSGENHWSPSGDIAGSRDYYFLQAGLTWFQRMELSQQWRFMGSLGAFYRWGEYVQGWNTNPGDPLQFYGVEFGNLGAKVAAEFLYHDVAYGAIAFDLSHQGSSYESIYDPAASWALDWVLRLGAIWDFNGEN